ncbi:MAG: hypothetical protein ACQEQU_07775, partial [Spirochaetota bacterium]
MRRVLPLIVLYLLSAPLHSVGVETVAELIHEDGKNEWAFSSELETDYGRTTMTRTERACSVTSVKFNPTDHVSVGRLVYQGIAARVHRPYRPMTPSVFVLRGILPSRSQVYTKSIHPQALASGGALLAATGHDRYGLSVWGVPHMSKATAAPEVGSHVMYGNGELALVQKQGGKEAGVGLPQQGYTAAIAQVKTDSSQSVQCAATMGLRWFPTLPTSSFSQIHVRGSFGRYTAGIRRTYID